MQKPNLKLFVPLMPFACAFGAALLLLTTGGVVPSAAGVTTQSRVRYGDVVHDRAGDVQGRTRLAGWADIRRTSRTVLRVDGHRRIGVTVLSRRDFPIPPRVHKDKFFFVVVYLDTHGGPEPDYHFDWRPFRKSGICDFDEGTDARIGHCRLRYTDSGSLWMSGRLHNLKVTKPIRFRTLTANLRATFDRAPNRGWRS